MQKGTYNVVKNGGKSPLLPDNYRPISFLSFFYILALACITRRIKPVLQRLIGKEQKAYLTENNIGSCIFNIINMIHFCNEQKKAAFILLVDFRKAFDSINHSYIENCLKLYGFLSSLIRGKSLSYWEETFLKRLFLSKVSPRAMLSAHIYFS